MIRTGMRGSASLSERGIFFIAMARTVRVGVDCDWNAFIIRRYLL